MQTTKNSRGAVRNKFFQSFIYPPVSWKGKWEYKACTRCKVKTCARVFQGDEGGEVSDMWKVGLESGDVTDNQFFINSSLNVNYPPFAARLNSDQCSNLDSWIRVLPKNLKRKKFFGHF